MEKQILIDFVDWLEKSKDYALCTWWSDIEDWEVVSKPHEIIDEYLGQKSRRVPDQPTPGQVR